VVRTRVGYCGGEKENPTSEDLGDHSESIQIDYDPSRITYAELLDVFWKEHDPARRPWCRQYAAFIFVHDAAQEAAARASAAEVGKRLDEPVTTVIRPVGRFWRAEDYHQKYRLRHERGLVEALVAELGGDREMVDSTAAARLNGLLAGYGERDAVLAELRALGISETVLRHVER